MLGILFEPYIMSILPLLLKCFNDANDNIRKIVSETSKEMMKNLSSHGIKLFLNPILNSLDENEAWKVKIASIQMLSYISYSSPKQLSLFLPKIVPKMILLLFDTHDKVQEETKKSFYLLCSVMKNPEIKKLHSLLIHSLADPVKFGKRAIDALLGVEFVHAIDSPSLSIIIPILLRGIKERSNEMKIKSISIIGNICNMIENNKDMSYYIGDIINNMKNCLVDPIPDVRSTTSKALAGFYYYLLFINK